MKLQQVIFIKILSICSYRSGTQLGKRDFGLSHKAIIEEPMELLSPMTSPSQTHSVMSHSG